MSSDSEPADRYLFGMTEIAENDYRVWCKENVLDPEDVGSMLAYEGEWVEEEEYDR